MRIALVWLGLATGCRSVLGFDEPILAGDPPPRDSAIDSADSDAPADSPPDTQPPVACPASYVTITDGQFGHRYRFVNASSDWPAMHNVDCAGSGGYLAIPNDAGELDAIFMFAGVNTWLGVSDLANEGSFVDVLGASYTAVAIMGNSGAQDCAVAKQTNAIEVESCNNSRFGVCECED